MDNLTSNAATLDSNVEMKSDTELYFNRRSQRVVTGGPFDYPVKVRVRAYSTNAGHGNNKADLTLMINGQAWGSAHDQNFEKTDLQVLNHMVLDARQQATFSIASNNSGGTTETYFGMDFWVSQA